MGPGVVMGMGGIIPGDPVIDHPRSELIPTGVPVAPGVFLPVIDWDDISVPNGMSIGAGSKNRGSVNSSSMQCLRSVASILECGNVVVSLWITRGLVKTLRDSSCCGVNSMLVIPIDSPKWLFSTPVRLEVVAVSGRPNLLAQEFVIRLA